MVIISFPQVTLLKLVVFKETLNIFLNIRTKYYTLFSYITRAKKWYKDFYKHVSVTLVQIGSVMHYVKLKLSSSQLNTFALEFYSIFFFPIFSFVNVLIYAQCCGNFCANVHKYMFTLWQRNNVGLQQQSYCEIYWQVIDEIT